MMAPSSLPRSKRLALPEVTLCAATSVNVRATLRALEASLAQIEFAACKLFTDTPIESGQPEITIIPIPRLDSSAAYSEFVLTSMAEHVETTHCLIAQWDGHVLDAERWRPEFLDYDYIGARWPQFDDGHDVGNGGFSLRSWRLMEACRDPQFRVLSVEDLAIGRENRVWLEGRGLRFAPSAVADLFAAERAGNVHDSFGYHGVWHMPHVIGPATFWQIYSELDDRSTFMHDFTAILKGVGRGPGGTARMARMISDYVKQRLGSV